MTAFHTLGLSSACALLLIGGTAIAREPKPDGLVAQGDPVDCLSLSSIRSTRVRDDKTIDFEVGGRKIYRNTLPHACPSLGFEQRYMFKTSLNQICSVDTITVLHSFGAGLSQGASCGLGSFQPMVKAAK